MHGGKKRIGNDIAFAIFHFVDYFILNYASKFGFKLKGYCEPFSGMLGVYIHIYELFNEDYPKLKYLAGDINESVIRMWQQAQKGWKPPIKNCSEKEFEKLKYNPRPSAKKGFIGIFCSYRNIFYQAYKEKYQKERVNMKKMSDNVINIAKKLGRVKFNAGEYTQYSKLKGYIIYCDPPYWESQSRYYDERNIRIKFDTYKFWEWCIKMSHNNIVFVSEYKIPKEFKKNILLLYSKKIKVGIKHMVERTEKVYVVLP